MPKGQIQEKIEHVENTIKSSTHLRFHSDTRYLPSPPPKHPLYSLFAVQNHIQAPALSSINTRKEDSLATAGWDGCGCWCPVCMLRFPWVPLFNWAERRNRPDIISAGLYSKTRSISTHYSEPLASVSSSEQIVGFWIHGSESEALIFFFSC